MELVTINRQVEQHQLMNGILPDEGNNMENEIQQPNPTAQTSPEINTNNFFSWFRMRPNIKGLETRAALSLSINVLPFWVCTFPVTCNAIALYWCIRLESDCSIIFKINPYLRNMFLFHAIYNPFMYMLTSHEFRRALSHFIRKRFLHAASSVH